MHPIEHIRKNIFKITQEEMAEVAGVDQGTISRWERGTITPGLQQVARIRAAARRRRLGWDDDWFFKALAGVQERAAS